MVAIIKRGWPDTTNADEAIETTIRDAKVLYPDNSLYGEPEIIATEEHKEAGEYLVKLLFV